MFNNSITKKIVAMLLILSISTSLFPSKVFALDSEIETGNIEMCTIEETTTDDQTIKVIKAQNKTTDTELFMVVSDNHKKSYRGTDLTDILEYRFSHENKLVKNDRNMPLSDIIENDKNSEYIYYNKVQFGIYSNEEEAIQAYDEVTTFAIDGFWNNSYIEDYYSWAGHGYHIYLSARDASYITNMGWISGDTLIGMIGGFGIITPWQTSLLIGIVSAAVITLYWREQNADGSLDIWSPDLLRAFPTAPNIPGAKLGTVKVGNHWYPLVTP